MSRAINLHRPASQQKQKHQQQNRLFLFGLWQFGHSSSIGFREPTSVKPSILLNSGGIVPDKRELDNEKHKKHDAKIAASCTVENAVTALPHCCDAGNSVGQFLPPISYQPPSRRTGRGQK
jgi:hypothetical protein